MSINRTAGSFAGLPASGTLMDTEVKALWDGLQDGWDSYSPSVTSTGTAFSLGNGAIAGQYLRIGKTLAGCRIALQIGSTTTIGTGAYRFSLPDELDFNENDAVGTCSVFDSSASDVYTYGAVYAGLVTGVPYVRAYGNGAEKVGATIPITLNTSDRITFLIGSQFN